MKLEVLLVEEYPHPVERVWRALTDPDALRGWLMENDFEPRVGKRFDLRGDANWIWRGRNECEVLAIEPPHRMVWSWISNEGDAPTRVEFRLEEIDCGTRLTLSHTGEIDSAMGSRITKVWPLKLKTFESNLSAGN